MFLHSDVKMEVPNLREDDLMTEESFKGFLIFMILQFSTLKNGPSIHSLYLQKWNGFPSVYLFVGKISQKC
jgi:hypothetical protein